MTDDAKQECEGELLPCPFCGAAPTSMWNEASCGQSEDCGYWSIECCVSFYQDSEAEAIAAWNTRQPQTAALHDQLLQECLVKLRDVQGTQAPKQYACNLIKRIERVLQGQRE